MKFGKHNEKNYIMINSLLLIKLIQTDMKFVLQYSIKETKNNNQALDSM